MAIVYVVQRQMKYDDSKGDFVDKFNFEPAKKFGEIKFLLSPSTKPFKTDGPKKELHEKLKNFGDDDFLLLVGNPKLIGMVTAIAAYYNEGNYKSLQWVGRDVNEYVPITVKKVFSCD